MALIELGIIDKRTGELYDAEIKLVRKNIGGAFLRVFQQPFRLINNLCSHGATRKVMMELLASANYQNAVPSTTKKADSKFWLILLSWACKKRNKKAI